jgi:hypothetical protein
MKISELIDKLEAFKSEHGDVQVKADYYCDMCHEYHEGVMAFVFYDGKLELVPDRFE